MRCSYYFIRDEVPYQIYRESGYPILPDLLSIYKQLSTLKPIFFCDTNGRTVFHRVYNRLTTEDILLLGSINIIFISFALRWRKYSNR